LFPLSSVYKFSSALFTGTHNQCTSLIISSQVFHMHTKEQVKLYFCVLIFVLLDNRQKDKRF
jgi:hypothetical protein